MSKFQIHTIKAIAHLGCVLMLAIWAMGAHAENDESVDEQLIEAADKGNVPMVRRILEAEQDLSAETMSAALFAGVGKGSKPIVQRLLERGR